MEMRIKTRYVRIPHGVRMKPGEGWGRVGRPTVATIRRGSERKVPHTGTETRARLLREAAVRNIGQWPRG